MSLLSLLTKQILDGRLEVDAAREIVLRRYGPHRKARRLDAIIEEAWKQALRNNCGNIHDAAIELGIGRGTLYRWMKAEKCTTAS